MSPPAFLVECVRGASPQQEVVTGYQMGLFGFGSPEAVATERGTHNQNAKSNIITYVTESKE